jgi:hypothetical protein
MIVSHKGRRWRPCFISISSLSPLAVQIDSAWSDLNRSRTAQFCTRHRASSAVPPSPLRHPAPLLLGTGPDRLPIHSMISHTYLPWRELVSLLLKMSERPGICQNSMKEGEGRKNACCLVWWLIPAARLSVIWYLRLLPELTVIVLLHCAVAAQECPDEARTRRLLVSSALPDGPSCITPFLHKATTPEPHRTPPWGGTSPRPVIGRAPPKTVLEGQL